MVTITSSYTVIPNESTPTGRLWLSDLDQLARFHHTQLIFIYKAKDNIDHVVAIERLRNSLAKILVPYYPVAGRFCWKDGRIELELNAKGAVLLEAETTKKISDYGGDNFFSPNESTKELVPVIDYNQPIEEIPLLVVQLTRFHGNNNNVVVGVAHSHALCDGISFFSFINSWAKISRGETINVLEPSELPFLDRTMLKFSHKPATRPRFDHIELEPLPLILGTSDDTLERNKKMIAVSLRLTAKQVEMLKKKANESDSDTRKEHRFRPYSKYEAISAHIWRCASKARELKENQPTVVRFVVEIRNRIIPALPQNYFGNACIQIATKGYIGEIISKPLGYVAQKIREANETVADEYIKSQIDVIRSGKEHKKGLFLGGEDHKALLFCGNPNLRLVNWMSLQAYEVDFGWGKPIHYGLAHISSHDRGMILSSPHGDGSVIVCMHFQVAHMQLFKKFFYEDIHEVFTPSRM